MNLELRKIEIKDVVFGEETGVKDGVLTVCKQDIIDGLKEDVNVKSIKVDIAKPGEKTRIIPVKDVIQPRIKVEGKGNGFPGVTSEMVQLGSGKVNVLDGVAVVTIGDIVGFQEGVIDMWGEGA